MDGHANPMTKLEMRKLELKQSRARDKLLRAVSDYAKTTGWAAPASQVLPSDTPAGCLRGYYQLAIGLDGGNYELVVQFIARPSDQSATPPEVA